MIFNDSHNFTLGKAFLLTEDDFNQISIEFLQVKHKLIKKCVNDRNAKIYKYKLPKLKSEVNYMV